MRKLFRYWLLGNFLALPFYFFIVGWLVGHYYNDVLGWVIFTGHIPFIGPLWLLAADDTCEWLEGEGHHSRLKEWVNAPKPVRAKVLQAEIVVYSVGGYLEK